MKEEIAITIRNTTPADFDGIIKLSSAVYVGAPGWTKGGLASHLEMFAEGQSVAVRNDTGEVVGMSASLIVLWDDYELDTSWRNFTAKGLFTNHDPERGRTLYGAEVMVSPDLQGSGIGKQLYEARRELATRLGLLRIRAGARLRGFHDYADEMTAEEYVRAVIRGEIGDPTLSFQLGRGFHIIGVVSDYLRHDPDSLGYAAVIEWVNPEVAEMEGYVTQPWTE